MPPSTPPGVADDQRAELRGEAEQDRHDRRDVVGGRGVDPGRGHDADVLGVGGGGRAADRAGEHGADAVGGDGPAHVGSRSVPVISATALTWPVFSAISAMTAGSTSSDGRELEVGASAGVGQAEPAARTRRLPKSTRKCVRDLAGAVVVGGDLAEDLVGRPRRARSRRSGRGRCAMRPTKPAQRHRAARTTNGHREQRDPLVLRPVDVGDDRRQVEADQHDDRAGDDRREDPVDARPRRGSGSTTPTSASTSAGDQDRAGHDRRRSCRRPAPGSRPPRRRRTRRCRGSWAPCP